MRPTVQSLLVALVIATPAWAQAVPASPPSVTPATSRISPLLDVAGGLTLARMEAGPDLDRQNLAGWSASVALYPLARLGIAAEFAGTRRTASLADALVPDAEVRLNQRTFLVGPTVRIIRRSRLNTSLRALFGLARVTAEFPSDLVQNGILPGQTPADVGVFEDDTVFAAAIGSHWDITLSRTLGIRLNPSLLITRLGDETQLTQRFSTGLVVRFGGAGPPR
jgi:hypothetical protein